MSRLQAAEACLFSALHRIMFMRPVKGASLPRTRAATAKYDPVWVTCDDLAAEGILVSPAAAFLPNSAQSWRLVQPAGSLY